MNWRSRKELSPLAIDDALKRLAELDVPLLYLEGTIVYFPERVDSDAFQAQLGLVAGTGLLTERTLGAWLERQLPPRARSILGGHLRALGARSASPMLYRHAVCCPVIFDYRSPLLPDQVLSGVRWVEVVNRGTNIADLSGFPEQPWSRRLGQLGATVRGLLGVDPAQRMPHWRLLDSLGRTAVESERLARVSPSLELGCAIAYCLWALELDSNVIIGATGQITDERGSVASIIEPRDKMIGIAREAACVDIVLATPKDTLELAGSGATGIAMLPIRSIADVIGWLRRRATGSPSAFDLVDPKRRSAHHLNADDLSGVDVSPSAADRLHELNLLIQQHEAHERWDQVARLLQKKIGVLQDRRFRISIHQKLAWLYEARLFNDAAAREAHEAVLVLDLYDLRSIEFVLGTQAKSESWERFRETLDATIKQPHPNSDLARQIDIALIASEKASSEEILLPYWRHLARQERTYGVSRKRIFIHHKMVLEAAIANDDYQKRNAALEDFLRSADTEAQAGMEDVLSTLIDLVPTLAGPHQSVDEVDSFLSQLYSSWLSRSPLAESVVRQSMPTLIRRVLAVRHTNSERAYLLLVAHNQFFRRSVDLPSFVLDTEPLAEIPPHDREGVLAAVPGPVAALGSLNLGSSLKRSTLREQYSSAEFERLEGIRRSLVVTVATASQDEDKRSLGASADRPSSATTTRKRRRRRRSSVDRELLPSTSAAESRSTDSAVDDPDID